MPTKSWVLALLFPYLSLSCQTGGNGTDSAPALSSTSPDSATPAVTMGPVPPEECPGKVPICTKEFSPVICTFSVYAGRPLKASERLVTWGSNSCVGLERLYQEACKNLMQPRLIGQMQCVPDASGGHCPPPQAKCASAVKPSVCTAHAYGREGLSPEQKMSATDANECLARARLKMEACRANLDPSQLAKISCESAAPKKSGVAP